MKKNFMVLTALTIFLGLQSCEQAPPPPPATQPGPTILDQQGKPTTPESLPPSEPNVDEYGRPEITSPPSKPSSR